MRLLGIALFIIVGSAAICGSALAQFWGDRPSGGWGNHRSGGWGWDDWGDRGRQKPSSGFFPRSLAIITTVRHPLSIPLRRRRRENWRRR